MQRTWLSLLVVLVATGGVPAGEKADVPKGVPPTFAVARMKGDRLRLVSVQTVAVEREVEVQRQVIANGKQIVVRERVKQIVFESRPVERDISGAQIYGTDGKPYDAVRLREVLKKDTMVVVSVDGRPVDPFYLRAVREGALVIVPPVGAVDAAVPPIPQVASDRPRPLPK